MFEKLAEIIKSKENSNTDLWLSNESCNKLIEEAETLRIKEGGVFELKFNSGDVIGFKTNSTLYYGEKTTDAAYAKVVYLNQEFVADSSAARCEVL